MTGGVTQTAIDLAYLLWPRGEEAAAARKRLAKFVPPVLAFAGGAIAGALAWLYSGYLALLAPMAALSLVLVLAVPAPPPGGSRE
mgnify:FL=1